MFYDTSELMKDQSWLLANEEAYYKEMKMLSFSSFKKMLECPDHYINGERPDWDKVEFLTGHGAEIYALEGPKAFEDWIKKGWKDGQAISEAALKQPSKVSMDNYEKTIQGLSWRRSEEDYKLPNGKKPTAAQTKVFERLLEECEGKTPEMPKPTEKAWVEQSRISGDAARRSSWMKEILDHPDTKLQHAICIKIGKVNFKMRIDLINPTLGIILDFKTVGYKLDRNSWRVHRDPDGKTRNVRINFIEDQNYLLQAAIYTMGAFLEFGEIFQYYIGAVEKTELPRFEVLEIPYEDLEEKFKIIDDKKDLFFKMINREMKPFSCGRYDCPTCSKTRNVRKPISWREI